MEKKHYLFQHKDFDRSKNFPNLRLTDKTFFLANTLNKVGKIDADMIIIIIIFYLKIFKNGSPSGHIGTCFSRSRLQTT